MGFCSEDCGHLALLAIYGCGLKINMSNCSQNFYASDSILPVISGVLQGSHYCKYN